MTMLLSYGMGVDSTALLLHWLTVPESRRHVVMENIPGTKDFRKLREESFELRDLIVLTAMTGDEFPDLKKLIEKHIMPRLRKEGVRYVQIARKSKSEKMVVLDDSRVPKFLYLEGKYKLSDELLSSATVPQFSGGRKCSIKSKGWPLDTWIKGEMGERAFTQAVGFSAEEGKRLFRDQSYSAIRFKNRTSIYPLLWDWKWTRQMCEEFIYSLTGVKWPKSACVYCPFASGKEPLLQRYDNYPEYAAFSLYIEHAARALNPRQTLYSKGSLLAIVQEVDDRDALKMFKKELDRAEWAIYRVRRLYAKKGVVPRSVVIEATGSRKEMESRLPSYGAVSTELDGIPRTWITPMRQEKQWRVVEELYVAAPKVMEDKEIKSFEPKYQKSIKGDWSWAGGPTPDEEGEEEAEKGEAEEGIFLSGSWSTPTHAAEPYDTALPGALNDAPRTQQLAWEEDMEGIIAFPWPYGPLGEVF